MLSRGVEPRRKLRYRPSVGDETVMKFSMSGAMSMASFGMRMFARKLDSSATIRVRVVDVDDRGNIDLELTIETMDMPDYSGFGGGQRPDPTGWMGTATIDNRGVVLRSDLPFLEDNELVRDMVTLTDYFMVFPKEAVGVGAGWETELSILRNGLTQDIVERSTLIELSADAGTVVLDQRVNTPSQTVPEFAFTPGQVFETEAFTSTGAGQTRFTPNRVLPIESETSFNFESSMNIRRPEQIQPVTMSMTAMIRVSTE